MKIAWYTPYSEHSAIGRFSQRVVAALRSLQTEVTVVRCERKTSDIRAISALKDDRDWVWAEDFGRNPIKKLNSFDIAIYNLGDHFDFHAFSILHQKRVPGITVLHDYSLHNALHNYCLSNAEESNDYREHLYSEFGHEALEAMDEMYLQDQPARWWNQEIARFPLFRWAMMDTLGTVTHANHYRGVVADQIGCPTTTIPLAYDAITDAKPAATPLQDEKFTIITVGNVNSNKRYSAIIRAIHESPLLRKQCRYRIVGSSDDRAVEQLQQEVEQLEHPIDVSFTGRVDHETLEREVSQAHIISCLRYPALEGASASVIEGLRSNRPVIVSDNGCYQEIPDDLTFKVSPPKEHQELTRQLEWIVNHYDSAKQQAVRANQWATERHCPKAYSKAMLEFIDLVLYNAPVLRTSDRVAAALKTWGIEANSPLLERIDVGMQDLFGRPDSSAKAA